MGLGVSLNEVTISGSDLNVGKFFVSSLVRHHGDLSLEENHKGISLQECCILLKLPSVLGGT